MSGLVAVLPAHKQCYYRSTAVECTLQRAAHRVKGEKRKRKRTVLGQFFFSM